MGLRWNWCKWWYRLDRAKGGAGYNVGLKGGWNEVTRKGLTEVKGKTGVGVKCKTE